MAAHSAGDELRTRVRLLAVLATLIGVTLLSALTGCTSSSSGSRATLYDSIDDLARDSTAIVVGTATAQRQDDETVISTVEVSNTPTNPQLGADVETSGSPITAGDTVEVRQMNSSGSGTPDALLKIDQQYLLFLTPSMLTGDAATQFFVTGAEAGLYIRDGDEFRRVVTSTGDALPEVISTTGNESEQ